MALAAGEGDRASLPNTWAQTMVSASHWVGLTLPGMIDEPGSFSGRISSPRPERGPEPSKRMSLAILNSAGDGVDRAVREDHRVMAASASNLFGAVTKGRPVISAMRSATFRRSRPAR
jgi:hypothetical protein